MKQTRESDGKVSAPATIPIATFGEVLDGGTIELVRDVTAQSLRLMLWDGAKETVGSLVEYEGRFYAPAAMSRSLLQELTLPTQGAPHGSTRTLLAEICKLVADYILLPEKFVSLVGRVVLGGWLLEAMTIAPVLAISGPDISRANQLLDLLHCVCRHPVRMTGVTPAGILSLPNGLGCTLLISQSTISTKLQRLLADASRRGQGIPHRGDLLDLFACQAIYCESGLDGELGPFRLLEIPVLPTGQRLPLLGASLQRRIAADFQPRLLNFRRANLGRACATPFDASSFAHPLRPLAQSLAAATPDEPDLQAEIGVLLRAVEAEVRSANWIDLSTVVIEAVIVVCREKRGEFAYVGDLAKIAQESWQRRGKNKELDPGEFGKRLKLLGFTTEPREAKGVKLALTEAVCSRAHQLARDFGVPEVDNDARREQVATGKEG